MINDMPTIRVSKIKYFMDPHKVGGDECQSLFVVIYTETPLGVICGRHLEFIHLTRQSSLEMGCELMIENMNLHTQRPDVFSMHAQPSICIKEKCAIFVNFCESYRQFHSELHYLLFHLRFLGDR